MLPLLPRSMLAETADKVPKTVPVPIARPIQSIFPYPPEKASIVAPSEIILPHPPLSLQQQPRRPPLHKCKTPTCRIRRNSISLEQRKKITYTQAARATAVELLEHFLKQWQSEMSVGIIDPSVGAVFGLVNAIDMDAEEGVG